ncbi:hypothetical protein [Paracoccus alkanivorans]|uniref:Uncharacterized protein n=1 Tax=Paracoccus alkanivorans TaxID=2116655 RepID=A0A3M0M8Z4_9RHOB|nr:hypothetical protein [Paracoccus alkanivorans]RMC33713.1 hypothetical protein C9E81_15510 [Paracoccus alkanivorans]
MKHVSAPSAVTLDRLQKAYHKAAKMVDTDPDYLPVFTRLEEELAIFDNRNAVIARAKSIARAQKEIA